MREILFRGKRVDDGLWIHGGISVFNDLVEMFDSNSVDNSCYEVIPETVSQFTGMTDKFGTKIFESDILTNPLGTIFIIEYFDASFKMKTENKKYVFMNELTVGYLANKYIIGNIHDNPELLK